MLPAAERHQVLGFECPQRGCPPRKRVVSFAFSRKPILVRHWPLCE